MKFDAILIRFGELTIKGKNRGLFIKILINNLITKLEKYQQSYTLKKEYDRLFVYFVNGEYNEEIISIVSNIFGIYSISLVKETKLDLTEITENVISLLEYFMAKTFKLEVRRNNKEYYLTSTEIKQQIAPNVLKRISTLKVDVKNPEMQVDIEIRKKQAYIFLQKIVTLGGLPVGSSGTGLVLMSGGIDSPVAAYLTMKRGMEVQFLHFATPPHTSQEALEKVFSLIQRLLPFNNKNFFSVHVVDFSMMQHELMHILDSSYRISIMRRMFFRIAGVLLNNYHLDAIITGESLGQVASQTIESINTNSNVINNTVLRPVICYDKLEIINLAKKIDTYEISILPFEDCCSLFVPKKPVTKPQRWIAEKQEKNLMWKEIIEEIILNHITTYTVKEGEIIAEKK